ncbi:hypothetical protein GQX74_010430 [Glossina fuscipes]|nr:hypothetical protein GQX74_010430 [Glossina fuscipes]
MKLEVVGIVRVSDGIPGFALNVNNFSENACFLPPNGKRCKSLCCVFNHVLFSRQDAMTIVVVLVVLVVVAVDLKLRLESDLLLSSSSLPFAEVCAEEWFSFEYCAIAVGCKNCLWPVGSSSQTLNGANLDVNILGFFKYEHDNYFTFTVPRLDAVNALLSLVLNVQVVLVMANCSSSICLIGLNSSRYILNVIHA